MTQWEKRVKLFQYLYSCLILEASPSEMLTKHLEEDYDFDANWLKVLEYIVANFDNIKEAISKNLSASWTYERVSCVDKAVMMVAIGEANTLDTPRAVVIDQALITAKQYNIDDSYKYINAILEKILPCKK